MYWGIGCVILVFVVAAAYGLNVLRLFFASLGRAPLAASFFMLVSGVIGVGAVVVLIWGGFTIAAAVRHAGSGDTTPPSYASVSYKDYAAEVEGLHLPGVPTTVTCHLPRQITADDSPIGQLVMVCDRVEIYLDNLGFPGEAQDWRYTAVYGGAYYEIMPSQP